MKKSTCPCCGLEGNVTNAIPLASNLKEFCLPCFQSTWDDLDFDRIQRWKNAVSERKTAEERLDWLREMAHQYGLSVAQYVNQYPPEWLRT